MNTKFNKETLKEDTLVMLGDSDVQVELESRDWNAIFDRVYRVYNKYRPKMIPIDYNLVANKQEYQLNRNVIGRGVFDLIFTSGNVGENFMGFDSSYFPLNYQGSGILQAATFLEWRLVKKSQDQVYGNLKDWEYLRDSNVLRITPVPTTTTRIKLMCGFNRLFGTYKLTTGTGNATFTSIQLKDEDEFPISNILPGFLIKSKEEIFRDNYDGTITSNKGGTGTVDYKNGTFNLQFNTAPANSSEISIECYEVREDDRDWWQSYVLALASVIVGAKRRRFGGIPGQQGPIDLDTEVKSEGRSDIELLEKRAKLWQIEYLPGRKLDQ